MATRYEIVNGPSKWHWVLAFTDLPPSDHSRYVTFRIGETNTTPRTYPGDQFVVIDQLKALDRARESWHFWGYRTDDRRRVEGEFNTQTRNGWIEEVDQSGLIP